MGLDIVKCFIGVTFLSLEKCRFFVKMNFILNENQRAN